MGDKCTVRRDVSRIWSWTIIGFFIFGMLPGNVQPLYPQTLSPAATVKSLRLVREHDGNPSIEIISTKPLVPAIRAIDNPYRLVIDLPNSRLAIPQKRINVQADRISTLRADQFQENPPVARIVVDLVAPCAYTWEAAGNRLVVHLGKALSGDAGKSSLQLPSTPSLTAGPKPAVATVQIAGPIALVGSGTMSGSSVTAGAETAVLGLARGGEVRVCPGTTLSVTPAQNGHNVMLAFNTGAFEAHYALDSSSDSIVTPDFHILLTGPGEFHLAISTDNRGNTCVRALPGNSASAIVSELMGDRTYQVKATDQLVFRAGRVEQVDMAVPIECGCPPPRQPVLRAENVIPEVQQAPVTANPAVIAKAVLPTETISSNIPGNGISANSGATSPSEHPSEVHVQIEAPFVFRASAPPPAPVEEAQALPHSPRALDNLRVSPLAPPATEPRTVASANPAQHPGFFRRLGSFFAALFR